MTETTRSRRRREDTERDWQPTTTSSAIALVVTVGMVLALLSQTDGLLWPTALGAVGAVTFAVSCWLLSLSRWDTLTAPVVSLLTLPTALGLFGSSTVVAIDLAGTLFPVESGALVSVTMLVILGHVGVVAGSVLAVLGVALGVRNVLTPAAIDRYMSVTFLTGLVPALVALVFGLEALLLGDVGVAGTVGGTVSGAISWLVAPAPTTLNLAGLLFVVALATGSVVAAINALPVPELLGDTGAGVADERRVTHLRRRLTHVTLAAVTLHVVTLGIEVGLSESALVSVLGAGLYGLLQGIASTPLLRVPLVFAAAVALAGATLGVAARRIARESVATATRRLGPLAGGLVATLAAIRVAEPAYTAILAAILDPLPSDGAEQTREIADATVEFYGAETFAVLLVLALVGATLLFLIWLRLATLLGYLSTETAGYSLASGGLFVGTVFAATLDGPAWLVFGGVVATLLVWDSGRFATTLGREVGSAAGTQSVELAHAGGTLVVGILGTMAAVGVTWLISDSFGAANPTTPVALVAVAVGLLSLVAALR